MRSLPAALVASLLLATALTDCGGSTAIGTSGGVGTSSGTTSSTGVAGTGTGTGTGTSGGTGSTGGLTTSSGSSSTSSSSTGSSSTGGTGGQDGGVTLDVPASNASLGVNFDVNITGSTPQGTSFAFTHGVGTVTKTGGASTPAFIYERQPWPQFSYTLYQTLAVDPTYWELGWFYCDNSNSLAYFEYEATNDDGGIHNSAPTGTCSETATSITEHPVLPASVLNLEQVVQGFTVSGTSLALSSAGPGTMTLNGASWEVFPFSLVDCSSGCGTPGWYELHSIYWNAGNSQTCFGIFYLVSNNPSRVQLEYSICLPDLNDPTGGGVVFDSSWTKP